MIPIKEDLSLMDAPPPTTPFKRGRGRPPKIKSELIILQADHDVDNDLPLLLPKVTRRPRKPETKPRKKYNKKKLQGGNIHDPNNMPLSSMSSPSSSSYYAQVDIPNFEDPGSVQEASATSSAKIDVDSMLRNELFNRRLLKNVDVIEENNIVVFEFFNYLSSLFADDLNITSRNNRAKKAFNNILNRMESLDKNLGSTLTNVLRGYRSQKTTPISIAQPWDLRNEFLKNETSRWFALQKEIDEYVIAIARTDEEGGDVQPADAELLKQKATSFFLGHSVGSEFPQYIYNSDFLATSTESKGAPETVVIGGGDPTTALNRHHTVVLSFRGDLNAGLMLPDIPISATAEMTRDEQELNIGLSTSLPTRDE